MWCRHARRGAVIATSVAAVGVYAVQEAVSCETSVSWFYRKPIRLRIALVRHGESMNNVHEAVSEAAYIAGRVPDPNLSPRGFDQAAALGAFLSDVAASALLGIHPVTELWVSPVKRTMQTMKPTATALGLSPKVRLDCFEAGGLYQGDATYTIFEPRGGLTRSEMGRDFPTYAIPEGVSSAGWYPPEGTRKGKEVDDECRARVSGVAASMKAEAAALSESKQVVLVVHYDFLCALLDALLIRGEEHKGPFVNWRHYNTGVTVVDINADGTVVTSMQNAVPHLISRPDLISGFDM